VSLEYDPVGRLDRVEYTGGRTTTYEYDANGNVTGRRTTP
jgi:YD repeat-containing protein